MTTSNKPVITELRRVLEFYRPALLKAFWFSLVASLLVLAPIIYMFEVYGRVVDAQSMETPPLADRPGGLGLRGDGSFGMGAR